MNRLLRLLGTRPADPPPPQVPTLHRIERRDGLLEIATTGVDSITVPAPPDTGVADIREELDRARAALRQRNRAYGRASDTIGRQLRATVARLLLDRQSERYWPAEETAQPADVTGPLHLPTCEGWPYCEEGCTSAPADALDSAAAVLARHDVLTDGTCRCGWGSTGLVTCEGELMFHSEHVAEQLTIAGVLRPGAQPRRRARDSIPWAEITDLAQLLQDAWADTEGRPPHLGRWDHLDDEARAIWAARAQHVLRTGRVHLAPREVTT